MAFRVRDSSSCSSHRYERFSSVKMQVSSSAASVTTARMVFFFVSGQTRKQAHQLSRPTIPTTGGRSFSQVSRPRDLLARRRGGSSGLRCVSPFFPRVLVHFVGFDLGIGKLILRCLTGEPNPLSLTDRFLNAVTPFQHRRVAQAISSVRCLVGTPFAKPRRSIMMVEGS